MLRASGCRRCGRNGSGHGTDCAGHADINLTPKITAREFLAAGCVCLASCGRSPRPLTTRNTFRPAIHPLAGLPSTNASPAASRAGKPLPARRVPRLPRSPYRVVAKRGRSAGTHIAGWETRRPLASLNQAFAFGFLPNGLGCLDELPSFGAGGCGRHAAEDTWTREGVSMGDEEDDGSGG